MIIAADHSGNCQMRSTNDLGEIAHLDRERDTILYIGFLHNRIKMPRMSYFDNPLLPIVILEADFPIVIFLWEHLNQQWNVNEQNATNQDKATFVFRENSHHLYRPLHFSGQGSVL